MCCLLIAGRLEKLLWVGACITVIMFTMAACSSQSPKGDAWLDLSTGKIWPKGSPQPQGPAIWGTMKGEQFEPSHRVEFMDKAPQPDAQWTPGWIELKTGRIHRDMEAVAPQQPYLKGRIDPEGSFHVEPDELRKWAASK